MNNKDVERAFLQSSNPALHISSSAIIRRYTTLRPKIECGEELWKLAQELKALPEKEFRDKSIKFENKFKDFLKEKNKSGRWKHGRLRSVIRSLKGNLEYLFYASKLSRIKYSEYHKFM